MNTQDLDSGPGAGAKNSFIDPIMSLTVEEKVTLLSGLGDFRTIAGVERLGIVPLKTTNSVSGIKPWNEFDPMVEKATTCFPSTSCYGATWNTELMQRLGRELARDARRKGVNVVLGPTINMHRDPRGGRSFECFSEDPLLTGHLSGAIVNGIQEQGVGACVKHLVCNDGETLRKEYDVRESLDCRTLREIYLASWQHLLRQSNPVAVMMAYNKVDGVYCSEHKYLIENILRLTWGYQGLTVSDWFGTKSGVKALRAGLDLEMPFPIHRGKKLTEDIKSGLMGEAELETSVRRLITLREQVTAPQADAKPTHPSTQEPVDLARDLILEGAVLLQNRKTTLPLDLLQTPNIAVFGEYAASPVIAGGGSVAAEPQYRHSFLDVLRKTHPQQDKLQYYPCVRTRVLIPLAPTEKLTSKDGNPGVDVAFFNNDSTVPFHTDYQSTPNVHMFGKYIPGLDLSGSRVEIVTSLTPATSGEHTLAVRVTGSFTLAINNKEVLSGAAPDMRPEDFLFCPSLLERRVQVSMKANEPCAVRLVMQSRPMMVNEPTPFGAALCFEEYLDENAAVEAAANVARDADVAIIFAGRDGQYESEGFDLLSLRLPPNQESMIRTIGASARRTVLVLHCGNPIDVSPFVDSVDAVINAHFMGQEGARGLVDLILGKVNPSGRLATTWFQTLEDYPSFSHFPPKKLADGSVAVQYSEGLKVGYRSPETEQRVRWPFGHGLSYTTFAYAEPRVSLLGSKLLCSVSVKNIGSVIGKEVVQLYITPPASCSVWRPHRELKAFKKVQVEAGQSCSVELNLDLLTSCSYWDEGLVAWRMEAGTYGVHIGSCTSHFEVSEEQIWNHL